MNIEKYLPIEQSQIVFDPKRDEIFNSIPNQ